jgi:hypothetical protein
MSKFVTYNVKECYIGCQTLLHTMSNFVTSVVKECYIILLIFILNINIEHTPKA